MGVFSLMNRKLISTVFESHSLPDLGPSVGQTPYSCIDLDMPKSFLQVSDCELTEGVFLIKV